MKSRKKKGSSLILVLAIALVFAIISGITASAVTSTMKGSIAEQKWESLLYAAESGIEDAVSKAGKNEAPFDGLKRPGEGGVSVANYNIIDFLKQSENKRDVDIHIDIECSGELLDPTIPYNATTNPYVTKYFLIKSVGKDRNSGEEREVKAKIQPRINTTDMFRFVLCGQVVTVDSTGSINAGAINSTAEVPVISSGSVYAPDKENAVFTVPDYKFGEVAYTNNTTKTLEIKADGTGRLLEKLDSMATAVNPDAAVPTMPTNGIAKFEQNGNKHGGGTYKVYLVNAKNLILDFGVTDSFEKVIIIGSGNITIKSTANVQATHGTIIGKRVVYSGAGAYNVQFPPFGHGNSLCNKNDIDELNQRISKFAKNWSVGGESGSSNDYWDSIEYDY